MNKVAKGFLFALAGVAALLVLLVLGVNLYVESVGLQTRLEDELTRELRMPVKLERVRFSFRKGLQVEGLAVAASGKTAGISAETATFLTAPSISARVEWGPLLLRQRLVVRDLLISSPTVVWAQTRKGRWELPRMEKPAKEEKPKAEAPAEEATPAEEIAVEELPKAEKAEKPPREKRPPSGRQKLEFQIAAARVENATFRFLDRKGRTLAVFEGVTLDCPVASQHEARGVARIERFVLQNRLIVEAISTPVAYSEKALELADLDARLAGGTVRGSYRLQPQEKDAPFTLEVKFDGVDLQTLLTQAASEEFKQRAGGVLRGSLSLQGNTDERETITGVGSAHLSGGRMEQNPLLQMLGQALQIDELMHLEVQQAELECRVGQERVFVDRLVAQSQNLSLEATGETHFDGKLELDAALVVNRKISRQLPNWINANFTPVPGDEERRKLGFDVGGTLSNPKTDLVGILVGERLEKQAMDLYRAFRSVTGSKKKDKKEKKEKKRKEERKSE